MMLPPIAGARFCARIRAMMSVGPAGAHGRRFLIGRSGYPAARALCTPNCEAAAAPIARPAPRRMSRREGRMDFLWRIVLFSPGAALLISLQSAALLQSAVLFEPFVGAYHFSY